MIQLAVAASPRPAPADDPARGRGVADPPRRSGSRPRGRSHLAPRSNSTGRAGDCGGRDYYWGHDTPWSPQNCPGKESEGLSSNACFLDAKGDWHATWGAEREMLVDWVRVWELPAAAGH